MRGDLGATMVGSRTAPPDPGANAGESGSDLAAVIEATEEEIGLYRRYGHTYGYVFYLCAMRS